MKTEDKEAIEFFKRQLTGKPDMSRWGASSLNLLPPVGYAIDLPPNAKQGDFCIVQCMPDAGIWVYTNTGWDKIDALMNEAGPKQFWDQQSDNFLVASGNQIAKSSKYRMICSVDSNGTGPMNNLTLDGNPSLQAALQDIAVENRLLKQELHEMKAKLKQERP